MSHPILTVGHSNHSLGRFLDLIRGAGVSAVADVRSQPYSRIHPHFNREALSLSVKEVGISYVFLGAELGARSNDPTCYDDGQVQYTALARTPLFSSGVERLIQGSGRYKIALLCAERDPLTCHRAILVGYELSRRNVVVEHIRETGEIESHAAATARLLVETGIQPTSLFHSGEECVVAAFAKRAAEIAYRRPSEKHHHALGAK